MRQSILQHHLKLFRRKWSFDCFILALEKNCVENNDIEINGNLLVINWTLLVFGLLHFKFDVLESILLYGGIWTSIYWEFNTFIYLVHLRNYLRQGVSFFTFCYLGVTGDSWTMIILWTSYTVAYLTTFILVLRFAVVMKPFLGGWSILLSNIETYNKSNLR